MKKIKIIGNQIGKLNLLPQGVQQVSILHINKENRPIGPAENSIVYLTTKTNGEIHARYIPWVGYFDIDQELIKEPNKWKLVEPSIETEYENVVWQPFIE